MGGFATDAVLLILAVWGAIVDSRYKRQGGKKPEKRHKILLLTATLLLVVPLLIVFGPLGNPLALVLLFLEATILFFAVWELGCWRVRRNNPPSML